MWIFSMFLTCFQRILFFYFCRSLLPTDTQRGTIDLKKYVEEISS